MFQIQLLQQKLTLCLAMGGMGYIGWDHTHTKMQIDNNQKNCNPQEA